MQHLENDANSQRQTGQVKAVKTWLREIQLRFFSRWKI